MNSEIEGFSQKFLQALYAYRPELGSYLGLHEYDGKLSDPSASAHNARIAQLMEFRSGLEGLNPASSGSTEDLDRSLIDLQISNELYELKDLRSYEWNPFYYLSSVDVSRYTKRSYAPLEERVEMICSHLELIPDYLSTARRNLRRELPKAPLETSIQAFEGQISYMHGDLRHVVGRLEQRDLKQRFTRANERAVHAIREFIAALRERLRHATDDFAIGRENFEKMLRYGEMVDLPLDRVLAVGQANLRENEECLAEAVSRINPGASVDETMRDLSRHHPTAEGLIPDAEMLLEDIRSFLIERDIVTVPSEVRCQVRESPPFMRWGFAFMDPPGPFERTATEAYYYITPVESSWDAREREEWLSRFNYNTLKDVSIHETYPGHYLHFLHMKSAPSDSSKALISYAFTEGWAHYCEQMMIEEGYGDGDPRLQAAQLSEALLRNCRYIASIGMHTQGMTLDEATSLFMEHGHMDRLPAYKEAVRGTFDPGYLYYTLGKLMLTNLRNQYRSEKGADFSLKEFHDCCLAYGGPPVPLLARQLLGKSQPEIL